MQVAAGPRCRAAGRQVPKSVLALCATADTVAEKSRGVNQKLLKRREHIEELNRVQQLLVKLQVGGAAGWCCRPYQARLNRSCDQSAPDENCRHRWFDF